MSVVKFYSKLRGFWSKLDNHVHISRCTCAGCTCKGCECNVVSKIVKTFEAEKSYQFLLDLTDDLYSQIRGQILTWSIFIPWRKYSTLSPKNSTRNSWWDVRITQNQPRHLLFVAIAKIKRQARRLRADIVNVCRTRRIQLL